MKSISLKKCIIAGLLTIISTSTTHTMWKNLATKAKTTWAYRSTLGKQNIPKIQASRTGLPSHFQASSTPTQTTMLGKIINAPLTDSLACTQSSLWKKYTKKLITSAYTRWSNYHANAKNMDHEHFKQNFIRKLQNGIEIPHHECLEFCHICIENKDVSVVIIMLRLFETIPSVITSLKDEVIERFDSIHPAILGALLKKDPTYVQLYTDKLLSNCKTGLLGTSPAPQKIAILSKLLRHHYYIETQKQSAGPLPFFQKQFADYHTKQIKSYRDYDYDWDFVHAGKEISFIEQVVEYAYAQQETTPKLFFKIHQEIMGLKP